MTSRRFLAVWSWYSSSSRSKSLSISFLNSSSSLFVRFWETNSLRLLISVFIIFMSFFHFDWSTSPNRLSYSLMRRRVSSRLRSLTCLSVREHLRLRQIILCWNNRWVSVEGRLNLLFELLLYFFIARKWLNITTLWVLGNLRNINTASAMPKNFVFGWLHESLYFKIIAFVIKIPIEY